MKHDPILDPNWKDALWAFVQLYGSLCAIGFVFGLLVACASKVGLR